MAPLAYKPMCAEMFGSRACRYVDIRYTNASTYHSSRPKLFSKTKNATAEPKSWNCSTSTTPHTTTPHPDPRSGASYQKLMMSVSAAPNLLSSRSPRQNRKHYSARRNSNNPSTMKPSQERTSRKSAVPQTRLHHIPQPKQPLTPIRSPKIGPHFDPRHDIRFTSPPQCKPYLF